MRRFAALYSELDAITGTRAKVERLTGYFQEAEPADAAWALPVLLGRQRKRLITGRRLRQICLEGSSLPEWLFNDCYAHVGDSAETIALLWRQLAPEQTKEPSLAELSLHQWMAELLPRAAALEGDEQAAAVRSLWRGLEAAELLVTFAKAYSGLDDGEITVLDRWIRSHTTERFGPVRAGAGRAAGAGVELAFEGLQHSSRHKSGIAVRFPRIARWRHDKPAHEADTLASALALLEA